MTDYDYSAISKLYKYFAVEPEVAWMNGGALLEMLKKFGLNPDEARDVDGNKIYPALGYMVEKGGIYTPIDEEGNPVRIKE